MGKSFSAVFVSNYINHHQIPFCSAMNRLLEGRFTFIQTEPMEEDRVKMGWHEREKPEYVRCFYEEEELCRKLILECDILLFGGTDDESYISGRLGSGRPIIRISERLYKTGQWKAVSPRGLRKKYLDHTRYRRSWLYLLCAGAYVASDFHLVRAYPGKMYCWGYFPEARHYDINRLWQEKGYKPEGEPCPSGKQSRPEESCGSGEQSRPGESCGSGEQSRPGESCGSGKQSRPEEPCGSGEQQFRLPGLLWAGRMIDWKHPELALETARYLKEKGMAFHLDMVGDGALRSEMEKLCEAYGLQEYISFRGYQSPEAVRRYMERADIFLFTSDRQEGWGAVANEAMNSGCALVAGHRIGAVPFLITNGENGFIYEDDRPEQLFALAERLVKDRELCRQLGKSAYNTIVDTWNEESAAERLKGLMENILRQYAKKKEKRPHAAGSEQISLSENGGGEAAKKPRLGDKLFYSPCMQAPILKERSMRKAVRRQWKDGI